MPVNAPVLRPALLALATFALAGAAAAGTGPFGVGLPEPAATGGGFLPGLFRAIAVWQAGFYRDLTATLHAMKSDGSAGLWLAGLSFLYGILHAAGPGHGKAVISAYVLANRESARNGAVLAMVSALAQAVSAVAMVSIAAILLGATSIAMTRAAALFETGAYALIVLLGLWLVRRKIADPVLAFWRERYAPVVIAPASATPIEMAFGGGAAICRHGVLARPGGGAVDCGCDHAHIAAPELAAGKLDWRKASTAIAAVGFRPCTGALIVLVFALSQGIYMAGVLSAFVMAIGTGVTVASLTLAAVTARSAAMRLARSGRGETAARVGQLIEAAAAIVVLLFGLTMLGASLYG
jgi:ABC-type nickel/cobalt efflux system permease component RcnA